MVIKLEEKMLEFARGIFAAHGVTDAPERLSGGWSNGVFAAGDMVLRCTDDLSRGRLARETQLARLLPVEAGYPEILDSGRTDGFDWTLCRRIAGRNLEDAWGDLSWDERAEALKQQWACAKLVHALDAGAARPFVNANLWYISTMESARAEADMLAERKLFAPEQCEAVKGYIRRYEKAMETAEYVPVHGDLTPANAMWNAGRIVSLMDLECAAIAPKEADLMMLLNTAYERDDLPAAKEDPAAEARFNERMRALVQAEAPDMDLLQGYRVIKLMHHVAMDVDDEDFSPAHEELRELLALLKDGKGRYAPAMA